MKVIKLNEAKASMQRRRYAGTALQQFDRLEREAKRQRAEQRAEVERKAREAL